MFNTVPPEELLIIVESIVTELGLQNTNKYFVKPNMFNPVKYNCQQQPGGGKTCYSVSRAMHPSASGPFHHSAYSGYTGYRHAEPTTSTIPPNATIINDPNFNPADGAILESGTNECLDTAGKSSSYLVPCDQFYRVPRVCEQITTTTGRCYRVPQPLAGPITTY